MQKSNAMTIELQISHIKLSKLEGWHSTKEALGLPTPPTRVRVSVFPKFFSEITWNYSWKNSFDVAELIDDPA